MGDCKDSWYENMCTGTPGSRQNRKKEQKIKRSQEWRRGNIRKIMRVSKERIENTTTRELEKEHGEIVKLLKSEKEEEDE